MHLPTVSPKRNYSGTIKIPQNISQHLLHALFPDPNKGHNIFVYIVPHEQVILVYIDVNFQYFYYNYNFAFISEKYCTVARIILCLDSQEISSVEQYFSKIASTVTKRVIIILKRQTLRVVQLVCIVH